MWKPLHIAAFAGLAIFELTVLGLALTPNVSADYRAAFIDRTSDCWPRPASGEVAPGKRISFLKADADGPAVNVLVCGWIKPDGTGTWSNGPESRLLLQLQPERTARLAFDLLPFLPKPVTRQRVEVSANGIALPGLELRQETARGQVIEVPGTAIGPDGRVALTLRFPDAISPREAGLNRDRYKLAVRLIFLTVTQ